MAKAIFAKIADNYYQIDQPTSIPTNIALSTRTTARMDYNESEREMRAVVNLAAFERNEGMKTNYALYEEMVKFISDRHLTYIKKIANQFMVYIDYSIYNNDRQEISHSCTTKKIDPVDAVLPLGVASNNECVYRRAKVFDPQIVFSVTNKVPLGVMGYSYGKRYTLKINDICILESIDTYAGDGLNTHNSIMGNSYDYQSHTVASLLKNNIPIYSSLASGIDIQEFSVGFYPRKITIQLHAVVPNMIVAYDDNYIKDIIASNIEKKYDMDDAMIHQHYPAPNMDEVPTYRNPKHAPKNDFEADENGIYTYLERCNSKAADALLVVENDLVYPAFNNDTMIHQSDAEVNIPGIMIGEYVRYVTGFDVGAL